MNTLLVYNNQGVPFNVKIVRKGERYGTNKVMTNLGDDPLVEFYDARQDPKRFEPEGQFVRRHHLSALMNPMWSSSRHQYGLDLMGHEPAWKLDGVAMEMVHRWLDAIEPEKRGMKKP